MAGVSGQEDNIGDSPDIHKGQNSARRANLIFPVKSLNYKFANFTVVVDKEGRNKQLGREYFTQLRLMAYYEQIVLLAKTHSVQNSFIRLFNFQEKERRKLVKTVKTVLHASFAQTHVFN